jgi:hypothetical protein
VPDEAEGRKVNPGNAPPFLSYTHFVEVERAIDGVPNVDYHRLSEQY